jgi:hypothetical protein
VPCKLTGRQNSVGYVAASARLTNSLAFERVAHACHPIGHRVITDLSECRITQAQIVKTQHAQTAARQAVGEDPV